MLNLSKFDINFVGQIRIFLKPIFLYFILIFTLLSCEEEITFSNNAFKPQIVLNSIFTNDSIWVVNLTHSSSVFSENTAPKYIDDAKIVITDSRGEQECVLYYEGNGVYKSFKCTSGQEELYRILVSTKKYGTVSAESRIPARANIKDLKISISQEYKDASDIFFTIQDNSQESNYFIWSIVDVDTSINVVTNDNGFKLDVVKWVTDVRREVVKSLPSKLDASISATELELDKSSTLPRLVTSKDFTPSGSGPSGTSHEVPMLRLMTVSPDLYNYYKSLQEYVKASNGQTSVIEPGKLYSNVKGGMGIFAGYSVHYFEIPK